MPKSREQKRAEKDAVRRRLNRVVKHAARQQLIEMRKRLASMRERKPQEQGLDAADTVSIVQCSGVGDCCYDRPLFVEPTDVFRILNNQDVVKKFGVQKTMDLYRKKDEEGYRLLAYGADSKASLPYCRVNLVDEGDKKVCPFKDGDLCVLGEDRLTQCKADPVCRATRVQGQRGFAAWRYFTIDSICAVCSSSKTGEEPNPSVSYQIRNWMIDKNMRERVEDSDLFHAFISWMHSFVKTEGQVSMASALLFNWDMFLDLGDGEIAIPRPLKARSVFEFARAALTIFVPSGIDGTVDKDKEYEVKQ